MFLLTHALQINSTLLHLYELTRFLTIAKTYISMEAGDVKNEKEINLFFSFAVIFPQGKAKYHISYHCTIICTY